MRARRTSTTPSRTRICRAPSGPRRASARGIQSALPAHPSTRPRPCGLTRRLLVQVHEGPVREVVREIHGGASRDARFMIDGRPRLGQTDALRRIPFSVCSVAVQRGVLSHTTPPPPTLRVMQRAGPLSWFYLFSCLLRHGKESARVKAGLAWTPHVVVDTESRSRAPTRRRRVPRGTPRAANPPEVAVAGGDLQQRDVEREARHRRPMSEQRTIKQVQKSKLGALPLLFLR